MGGKKKKTPKKKTTKKKTTARGRSQDHRRLSQEKHEKAYRKRKSKAKK